jgi:acyl-CoA thioesterase I
MVTAEADIPAGSSLIRSMSRLGKIILATFILLVSLLVFPNAIPWLVAFWLCWHTLLMLQNRPGWQPLAVCIAVLLVKRTDWPPSLLAMAFLMGIACLWRMFFFGKIPVRRTRLVASLGLAALWACWAVMAWEWYASSPGGKRCILRPERPIVCLGDSLTAFGYPQDLAQLVSVPVMDLSYNGISIQDGIERLPLIREANPQAVLIELGGNDYLRGCSRVETKQNLERIIDVCHSFGAEVVLLEMPRGFIIDPYAGMEREIARQKGVTLVPDTPIRKLVLWSPHSPPGMWLSNQSHFSDDGLHPNAQGNKMLAEYLAEMLTRMYGPSIRAKPDQSDHSHEK